MPIVVPGARKRYYLKRFSGLILTLISVNLLLLSVEITPLPEAAAATLPTGFKDDLITDAVVNPTVVRFASDGRMFVAEKSGIIRVFNSVSDVGNPTVFADLSTEVYNYWDRGLLGMALDPNFPTNPYIYVLYTLDALPGENGAPGTTIPYWNDSCPTPPGANTDGCAATARLSRLTAQGNTMVPDSEEVLISGWCVQFPSHTIGDLVFASDGSLYVSGGDGASYINVDYGQYGASLSGDTRNPCGDPPGGKGGAMTPPTARGGALRSQSPLRPAGDPVILNGTILRVDPATGDAEPDNPGASSSDANARRIIAYGLRNPFRFTTRANGEVWVGDVGYNTWEEMNRITDPTGSVKNFGWPCYEGNAIQPGYQAAGLTMCQNLYDTPGSVISPYYAYYHSVATPGQNCSISTQPGTGISSSITGMAFYNKNLGDYPAAYDEALFFADYSRACIWVMYKGTDGNPDPSTIVPFVNGIYTPIQLVIGPGGNLFIVGLLDNSIRRVQYQAPIADARATTYNPAVNQPVTFDASHSSSPTGKSLTYSWDLDGDGVFGDATGISTNKTFTQPGAYKVWLRVTDSDGKWSNSARITIQVGKPPVPVISTPSSSLTWKVGDTINFSGSATDPQDGTLAASKLSWTLIINHCPSTCHQHIVGTINGVSSGSFIAPDHEYPSTLELQMTATNSWNISATTSVDLNPQTVVLSFNSSPPGLEVALNSEEVTTPFTRTVIAGSMVSVSAPWPQTLNDTDYTFDSWSVPGLAQNDTFAANTSASYTANFLPCNALLVNNATDDDAPSGDCQVTLRSAIAADSASEPIKFIKTLDPITLTAPLAIPAGINLTGDCDSKQQIIASSSNKLSLQGNNALKGLDLLLNMPHDSPRALDLAGKQIQFEGCTSIQVVNG
jgi:glucose/arabinose dehydrogenase